MIFIIFLVFLALAFDFINGFHDSANSVATIVSTRVLSPKYAVIWASFFNFIAFFFFGLNVSRTISQGIIDISVIDSMVIFSTLSGAIIWNLITWYVGIPSSSSHALIGGLIGSAIIKTGSIKALIWSGIIKTTLFIFISPIFGLILGVIIGWAIYWIFRKKSPMQVDNFFRIGQFFSAALYSIGHGGNDAQKTMGIIASLLFGAGLLGKEFSIPFWVVLACYLSMALGTATGGWRIVKTMGQKVVKLRPVDGFCAELGAAVSLATSTFMGIPVSTTQTIAGSIMGIGMLKRFTSVRWQVARGLAYAWILTIPCSAVLSSLFYLLIRHFKI
ncbi:MAG: inorganic phosphate transporter [Brevinematales bacterium]|jgi:PiT family inorganic phosphate transporter